MQKHVAILTMIGVIMLTASCSKTTANERNFGAALTQYFDKKGDLCLNIKKWPVDISAMDIRLEKTMPFGSATQMAALESAGLVKGVDTVVGDQFKTKVKRYTLTDAAKPFIREETVDSYGWNGKTKVKEIDIRWGKMSLKKIVKWEGPIKLGDYQEADVTYTYNVTDVADWARRPEVQAAFPSIKNTLDAAGSNQARRAVKLTSQGWEAKGLD